MGFILGGLKKHHVEGKWSIHQFTVFGGEERNVSQNPPVRVDGCWDKIKQKIVCMLQTSLGLLRKLSTVKSGLGMTLKVDPALEMVSKVKLGGVVTEIQPF